MSAEYRRQSLGGRVVSGHLLLTVIVCLLVMLVQPAQPQTGKQAQSNKAL